MSQVARAELGQQPQQHHEHHGRADDDIHQGSTVSSMGVCATGISPSSSDTMPLLPPIRAGLICTSIFISSRSPAFTASYLNWNASPETVSSAGAGTMVLIVTSRSVEHTTELQSLMCTSYSVFCS